MRQNTLVYRRKSLFAAFAVLLVSGGSVAACDALACDLSPDDNKPSDFTAGIVHTNVGGDKWYESSTPYGRFLNFSQGTQVRVHHQLGSRPGDVQLYVSFSSDGQATGNEAPPAGNMTEIECIDDEEILIRNNSCADYWLRVVASDPVEPMDGGTVPDGSCSSQ